MTSSRFIRIGRVIYRRGTSRNVPVRTCPNEFIAALRLRDYIRLDGGRLGRIPD
jgi:hypothetical protein